MKKKSIPRLLFVLAIVVLLFTACGRTAQPGRDAQVSGSGAGATTEALGSSGSEKATPASSPAETSAPAVSPAEASVVSNSNDNAVAVSEDLLQKDMEAADSYRRGVFYISTPPKEAGSPIDVTAESAYVKNPVAISYMNESKAFGSYLEQIIMGNTIWERSAKTGIGNHPRLIRQQSRLFNISQGPCIIPSVLRSFRCLKPGTSRSTGSTASSMMFPDPIRMNLPYVREPNTNPSSRFHSPARDPSGYPSILSLARS